RVVEELELQLGIIVHWTPDSERYKAAETLGNRLRYQQIVDKLELLLVQRLFELTRMNRSGTGYKMRRHIAKSLQARSKAVRNAIDAYNEVAAIQDPRKPLLAWEEVVEYAFLSDFDLLRDSKGDVQRQPWTRLAYRTIMDKYFRLERAREEIKRLNLEIPRFITWI
ncbi:hypothetical protein GGX14DRAFT_342548, partial [Mycena pura]